MVKSKVFIYNKEFDGLPKEGDLLLKEEDLPPIKDGEFLAEAVYISIEPFMRSYATKKSLGSALMAFQIAKRCSLSKIVLDLESIQTPYEERTPSVTLTVALGHTEIVNPPEFMVFRITESRNPDFSVGRHVLGFFGCRTHTISNGVGNMQFLAAHLVPELEDVPISYFLGILGTPGNTAYFGFLEVCQPKEGETVVVSAAGGSVGCIVGQIAKIKGCRVIGITGSDLKGTWLVDDLGFDDFINYKTDNIGKVLTEIAPKGVDCYFDNVGGKTTAIVMEHMNNGGRISVSGTLSTYIEKEGKYSPTPIPLFAFVSKQLKMKGFLVYKWIDRFPECVQQNLMWIKEGRLKYRETITEGFENLLGALVGLLQGKNFGKALVKI